jgi:hypothetical protein
MWEFREKSDFSLRFTGPLNAVYLYALFQCAFSQLPVGLLLQRLDVMRLSSAPQRVIRTGLELYTKNFSHATVDGTES